MTTSPADVIVVGAGTAGAIVAARLADDTARNVLVLEAGPVPGAASPPAHVDARIVPGADTGRHDVWRHPTRLTAARDYTLLSGCGLGGSSAINGAYFVRPRPDDVAAWHAAGGAPWEPARVLRLLIELEADVDYGATAIHSADGPIPVTRTSVDHPAARMLAEAAVELGFAEDPDKNAWESEGVGPVPCSMRDGVRWDAGADVLWPMLRRPNLTVTGRAQVCRVLVERGRAVGVEYVHGGELRRARADRVVLCAGAIGSAQLLLVSGIGPAAMLRAAGVAVVADASGVGATFSSHPQIALGWMPNSPLGVPAGSWLVGALHAPGLEVLATGRPLSRLGLPPAPDEDAHPLALMAQVVAPRREGRVRLRSPDPDVPLDLDHRYLSSAAERRQLRQALRLCAALMRARAWRARPLDADGTPVDAAVFDDDHAADAWIAAHLGTTVHVTGTVPFGGPDAPVDGLGSVRAVPGLTVADASILPAAPRRGPAASVALVARLVASALAAG